MSRNSRGAALAGWLIGLLAPLLLAGDGAAETKPAKKGLKVTESWTLPRKEPRTFEEILESYAFVGDFNQKEPERPISDEIFWRYPYRVPEAIFEIETALANPERELPATKGGGRPVEHLNEGRVHYLKGKFEQAKATWLSARARFGKNFPYHRRNDYFIGLSFIGLADQMMKERGVSYEDDEVRGTFANAATFYAWAFIVKADEADPLVDDMMPKGLYNLASIYWQYKRFAGAYGAAQKGLDFLRKTGRKEYRTQFHRFMAEAYIKNRTYLEAVQELDVAIRQDPDPRSASEMFARVGDIYFDLNNYELASDAYELGAKIDEELRQVSPAQMVLRGESLFWLGKFSEAQKVLHYALEGGLVRRAVAPLPPEYAPYAALRIADAYLARKQFEKAKLEYYKVVHDYRGTPAAAIANVRSACLELPEYEGNNVRHARELLEEAKKDEADLPPVMKEMAWACQVASYAQRERTPAMVERVRAFHDRYPTSRFLAQLVEPVREVQASRIHEYFKEGALYSALSYFEKNRNLLYRKVDDELGRKLFAGYVDIHHPEKASEFWRHYDQAQDSDLKLIRQAVTSAEMAARSKDKLWKQRDEILAKRLATRAWQIKRGPQVEGYLQRLLASESGDRHAPWVYRLVKGWSTADADSACNLQYPLLSRMLDANAISLEQAREETVALIKAHLPQLFRRDESCAVSLLDLEARVHAGQPSELAEKYMARNSWPLRGPYLHHVWTIAENLWDKDRAKSRRLLSFIVDQGPKEAPEVSFAKDRLDPTRTETEKLWD